MANAEAATTDTPEEDTGSEDRLEAAGKIISSSAMWSGATGAIPIPIVDMGALAAVQATMISRIASLYGESLTSASKDRRVHYTNIICLYVYSIFVLFGEHTVGKNMRLALGRGCS